MSTWTFEQLDAIATSDDFHIAPYHADGITPGTLTWIWSVVVDDALHVRAYNGTFSRWYQSALAQKAGRITTGGIDAEVSFTPVTGEINDQIDAVYREKYGDSQYVPAMTSERTRQATVRVEPM